MLKSGCIECLYAWLGGDDDDDEKNATSGSQRSNQLDAVHINNSTFDLNSTAASLFSSSKP